MKHEQKKAKKKQKGKKNIHKKKFFIDVNFLIVSTYGRAKISKKNIAFL